jgi:LysR family transcriptional activator of nhaA
MARLNYHHLYYFWQVARTGNLTRTAKKLHISQSALSSQIKQLEASMDLELFNRDGRKLVLTESGQRILLYAEEIFSKGEELELLLSKGFTPSLQTLRIGTLATMSRNFIESFIEPIINRENVSFSLHARRQPDLLNELSNHQFDMALTNIEVLGGDQQLWRCQLLARQPVSIIGPPGLELGRKFNHRYVDQRWVLPVTDTPVRSGFDGFCAQYQFKPKIFAQADDMPMLRLLARDSGALAVMPEVVVKDELLSGKLVHYMTIPNLFENFYAVAVKKHYPNELINQLLAAFQIKSL